MVKIKITVKSVADEFGMPWKTIKSWYFRNRKTPKDINHVEECRAYYRAKKHKESQFSEKMALNS